MENKIYSINGPVVTIKGKTDLEMMEMVYVGNARLVGEFVLVLEGAPQREKAGISLEEAAAMVLRRREEGEKLKDAVKEVAQHTDLPRNELYAAALRLSEEG